MRAASAILRTNIGVLSRSDVQRSHWLSSGSVWAESVTDSQLTDPPELHSARQASAFGR